MAATNPPQHPPLDSEGPPSGSSHTRRSRCDRPPTGTAASGGGGKSGWGDAIRGGGDQQRGRRQRRGARTGAGGADRGGGGARGGVAASGGGWRRAARAAAGGEVSGAGQGKGSLRGGARPGSICEPAEHAGVSCHTLSYDAHIHRIAIVSSRPGIFRNVTGALVIVVSPTMPQSTVDRILSSRCAPPAPPARAPPKSPPPRVPPPGPPPHPPCAPPCVGARWRPQAQHVSAALLG